MDRYEIYFKLREICSGHLCTNCPISFINSKHRCGHGYGYSLNGNQIPLSEALKYYSIIFGKENLRATIEKRRENDRYERRDTIILNGKVGWVNTGDDANAIIRIQNIQKVKKISEVLI